MKMQSLPSILAFFCLSLGLAQGDAEPTPAHFSRSDLDVIQDQRIRDSLALWEERVYLHTDSDRAEAGEAIFFKAYVFNGPTRRRFSPGGVLRLELRDDQNALVATQHHPIREGGGEGVLRLPRKMEDGTYQLRAYTRWMQNYGEEQFFRKDIRVGQPAEETESPSTADDTGVSFHPEGGRLLAGIANRLVVRQPGSAASSLMGVVTDSEGKASFPVQAYNEGYGMVIFTPEAGRDYQFRNADGEQQDLPEVAARGYALKVNNLSPDKITLEVEPTLAMGGEPVVLKGEWAGQVIFIHMLEFEPGRKASLDIPKNGMPEGFVEFSLTGLDDTVWARRPVWIGSQGNLNIEVEPLDNSFSKGAEAGFRIRVTDPEGNPVRTDLSVAVTDTRQGEGINMLEYLNPVASPNPLQDDRGNRFLQDLRAWSDPSGAQGRQWPLEIRYPVQRSLELHGTAYDLENNLLANTEIQMLASSDSSLVIREARTDASGIIHLAGLDVVGETQFVFRTKGEEQEQRLVKVIPLRDAPKVREGKKEVVKSKTFRKEEKRKKLVEPTAAVPWDTTGVIKLKGTTVTDRLRAEQESVPSLYGLQPLIKDVVYQNPERPLPIDVLAQNIPGVQVRPTVEGVPVISHMRRGGGSILWVVDGQVIYTNDPYLSPLTFLTPNDILRMEFYIEVAQTAMFGVITSPGTGVMVVYTRNGSFLDYTDRKNGGLLFKGYEPGLDFETYLTENTSGRKSRKEPPNTLYWDPSVETDEKGEAVIRFRSPADYSRVHLSVETLTPDGLVGSLRKDF